MLQLEPNTIERTGRAVSFSFAMDEMSHGEVSSTTTAALLFPRISIIRTFHGILADFKQYTVSPTIHGDGQWLNLKGNDPIGDTPIFIEP